MVSLVGSEKFSLLLVSIVLALVGWLIVLPSVLLQTGFLLCITLGGVLTRPPRQ